MSDNATNIENLKHSGKNDLNDGDSFNNGNNLDNGEVLSEIDASSEQERLNERDAFAEFEEIRAARHEKFERNLKRILIVCSILLGAELLWLFLITPCLPLSSVDVKTPDGISRGTVLAYSGINARSSYMSVDAQNIERKLSVLPLVESVKVIKSFPDSVSIILKGRNATAMSLAIIDGISVPVFFDKFGVIFKIGAASQHTVAPGQEENILGEKIPIISGLYFENIKLGTRLPAFLIPLLEDIQNLKDTVPELLSAISEIHINKKTYDGFDLVVYPAFDTVKIRMSSELSEANIRYMLLLLDVMNEKGMHPSEIDFRTGTASYKF
ncbi:hypothetical protein FACS1894102_5550 [Spirochaetia bacterium]|nr:hypothetical protein FACS1894102_5550 [Spirochaetia bacterium]